MTTMQEKIVAKIHAIAAESGLEALKVASYSNILDFHFQRPGAFDTLFTIHASFQNDHVIGGVVRAGERVVSDTPHRSVAGGKVEMIRDRSFHAPYATPGKLNAALEMITREARSHAAPASDHDIAAVSDVVLGTWIWDNFKNSASDEGSDDHDAKSDVFDTFGEEHVRRTIPGFIPFVRSVIDEIDREAPAIRAGAGAMDWVRSISEEASWDDQGRLALPSVRDAALSAIALSSDPSPGPSA